VHRLDLALALVQRDPKPRHFFQSRLQFSGALLQQSLQHCFWSAIHARLVTVICALL
jgi:hypothetical protein